MDTPRIPVDLRDPATCTRIAEAFLAVQACPVEGHAPPPPLSMLLLVLQLPDGSELECEAQVVRATGPDAFVAHLQEKVDVARVRFLAEVAGRAKRASKVPTPRPGSLPPPTLVKDVVWPEAGTDGPRGPRPRHLPRPDSGSGDETTTDLPARRVARPTLKAVQPPPKVAGGHAATGRGSRKK